MVIVISVGGSLVYDKKLDLDYLKKLSKILKDIKEPLFITVGGGKIARQYIKAASDFSENAFELDMLGIAVTKANARVVAASLGGLFFDSAEDAIDYLNYEEGIVVVGGTRPGQSTDSVAALAAEELRAVRFVNLSNVRGIYDKDPKKKGAKLVKEMTHRELTDFAVLHDKRRPGKNFIIDVSAARVLQKTGIESHFVDGKRWSDVKLALAGKLHKGTVVRRLA